MIVYKCDMCGAIFEEDINKDDIETAYTIKNEPIRIAIRVYTGFMLEKNGKKWMNSQHLCKKCIREILDKTFS